MAKSRAPYAPEFRAEAVRLVREQGRKISVVARELGMSDEALRLWVRQAEVEDGEREGLTELERDESRRLRRETRILAAAQGSGYLHLFGSLYDAGMR